MSTRKRQPLPYSPNTYTGMVERGSPTKATNLLQEDHEQYVETMKRKRSQLIGCLDLYRLCYEQEIPQKCLKDDNFITLYCLTQGKLLCVNCLYKTSVHKQHQVAPSKNLVPEIARQNERNIKLLEQELQRIRHVESESKKNFKSLQEEYNFIRKMMEQQFKKINYLVKRKEQQTKARINQAFQKALSLTQSGNKQIQQWRSIIMKIKASFPKATQNEQTQIYKSLALRIFQQNRIDQQKMTYMATGQQIRSQFMKQITDLRQLIEQSVGVSQFQTQRPRTRIF